MEKLTLKHLAPYLPYRLKFKNGGNEPNFKMGVSNSSHCISIEWILESNFKPILRPLSDLTKVLSIENNEGWEDDWIEHVYSFMGKIHEANILACPYNLMQFLLEKHIDVFELIPKGLAIDINTLIKTT